MAKNFRQAWGTHEKLVPVTVEVQRLRN